MRDPRPAFPGAGHGEPLTDFGPGLVMVLRNLRKGELTKWLVQKKPVGRGQGLAQGKDWMLL